MLRREIWRNFDYWLLGTVVILIVFGIAMIRSAIAGSPGLAGLDSSQATWAMIGLAVVLVTTLIDYRYWASLTRIMYVVTIIALIGIKIIGDAVFGSARWFNLGGFNVQPSELGKIVIILSLSDYFARNHDKEHDLRWIATSLAMTLGVAVWVYLQPNLSTTIVIMVIWFALLWISGLKPKHLVSFGVIGLVGALMIFPFLEGYQQDRVFNLLFPDPNATHGETYNVDQALISVGSGGWFGAGYGHGTQVQLRFMKVRHTDFIFSAMAEEFGFVGTVIVVALLIVVVLRCFHVARTAADIFGSYIAYSFGFLLFFQMAVNIGVNLKVLPVTGLTLPFVSYGGSSLLSLLLGIGLVESVAAHRKSLD
ncbi:MAG TPA: FtsW/RodA/SpoVE family cell cycle protein [Anaerolineaceae bacterium]|nr:FtsW/RodA/SpoVE family cell cycle protein [Anaerolineaceae bacterium]